MPENPCVGGSIPPGPTLEPRTFYSVEAFLFQEARSHVYLLETV